MSDSESTERDSDGARMVLEPDALHEGEEENWIDCPSCGSPASITQVVEHGRCSNYLDAEVSESGTQQLQDVECEAELSLELVWEA